jgi:hypothetical protein
MTGNMKKKCVLRSEHDSVLRIEVMKSKVNNSLLMKATAHFIAHGKSCGRSF